MNKELNYNIQIGTQSDIKTIAQFQVDMALESEGTTLSIDTVIPGVEAAINDSNKATYVIAYLSGNPIASLMITKEWSDWTNKWYWWIQSVYVIPQYRGKGVYKAMYNKIKDMALQNGVTQIRLYVDKTNVNAQKVYQKLGMSECHYLMYEETIS
jgi:ribosomal protein S18 acetylase RimI-like enzyme